MVNTSNWTVSWNWDNTDIISFTEFFFLSLSCTSHSGQFFIHTEEVLIGNRSRCLGFILNRNTFLSFNGLMKSVRIATSFHGTTGELVNDQNFLFFANHIIDIQNHDIVSTQGIINEVSQCHIFNIIEII